MKQYLLPIRALLLACLATCAASAAEPLNFSLPPATGGKAFNLAEHQGHFVALHFLLKTECPYCLRHTRDYASKSAGNKEVVHVFIKPDTEAEIREWADKLGAESIAVYRDVDAKLADQLKIPGGYQFHGQTVHYPALVLLDPSGREVFRYVGKDNSDRLSYEQFLSKLAEIKGKPAAAIAEYNLPADHLAIQGYDPVAYFTEGRARKGDPQINATYRGVRYQFASIDHRTAFLADPEKFVPTYGGWCATAMAKGEKVEINPTNFKVTNGRLFLFFKAFYANAIKDWNKDEANLTDKADSNWKKISGE